MSDGGGDFNTNGIGFGNFIENQAKMNMNAREAEARLRRKHPGHEPPPRDGIIKRMIRRMRGGKPE